MRINSVRLIFTFGSSAVLLLPWLIQREQPGLVSHSFRSESSGTLGSSLCLQRLWTLCRALSLKSRFLPIWMANYQLPSVRPATSTLLAALYVVRSWQPHDRFCADSGISQFLRRRLAWPTLSTGD